MQMSILHLIRYAVFGVLVLFSLIVLGIAAHFTSVTRGFDGFTLSFEGLCVAVAVLTLVTVVPVAVIDFLRRGAFTSLVVVELAWSFVLMILWVAAAGQTSATFAGCNESDNSVCSEFQALQAFAWLNFIILLGYVIGLCVCSAITHNNGNPGVWTSSVPDTQFLSKGAAGQSGMMGTPSSGYPPQQHTGQPMQQGYSTPGQQQPYQGTPTSQPGYGVAQV